MKSIQMHILMYSYFDLMQNCTPSLKKNRILLLLTDFHKSVLHDFCLIRGIKMVASFCSNWSAICTTCKFFLFLLIRLDSGRFESIFNRYGSVFDSCSVVFEMGSGSLFALKRQNISSNKELIIKMST